MSNVHTIEYLPLGSLKPDPKNPRTHSKKQVQQIADSIENSGYFNPILIEEDHVIICGHGRYRAAKLQRRESVPVIRLSGMTSAAKRALRIADNKIAMNASWDVELLRVELEEIQAEGLNLELTGFAMGEIDTMLTAVADPDDEIIPAVPEQPVTRPGDIWICGAHRIGCGDLLDGCSMAALMSDERADAIVSDPPYNVEINGFANAEGRHREFQMASGEMSPEEFLEFIRKFIRVFIAYSRDGAVHLVFMDWRHIAELISIGRALYGAFLNLCVWNKSNAGMGSLYRSKHELISIFRVGDTPHFNAVELGRHGRNRTNVFDYASVNSFVGSRREDLVLHPTVKPTALVADAIQDVTRHGDIVLDGFLGSGTNLVACELTGRQARGLEIEPAYVDVALQRWIAMTGQQPILKATGESFEQRQPVHAIAQARRLRSVVEHVAKVPAAARAQHFGPLYHQLVIPPRDDRMRKHLPEARPAGAALELGRRAEQRKRAAGADEDALAMLIEHRARESMLGRRFAQHRIALRSEEYVLVGTTDDIERARRERKLAVMR